MTVSSSPTDDALSWLSLKAQGGALVFTTTEDGDVGLFEGGEEGPALGSGDTAGEALADAHGRYHKTPGLEKCDCVQLEQDGDALP